MNEDRIAELNKQIADLKKSWPAHSIPPAMMERLDALEEELTEELRKRAKATKNKKVGSGK